MAAFSGNNSLPDGWLLCNGTEVSRETYAALYSVIGDTYGDGDGSTTFNLPNLTDKFLQGNAVAGTEHSAGLPNIEGLANVTFNNIQVAIGDASGALNYRDAWGSNPDISVIGSTPSSNYGARLKIDASQSNPIYGNSNTVQPPAVTMKYAIYSGVVSKKLWLRTI